MWSTTESSPHSLHGTGLIRATARCHRVVGQCLQQTAGGLLSAATPTQTLSPRVPPPSPKYAGSRALLEEARLLPPRSRPHRAAAPHPPASPRTHTRRPPHALCPGRVHAGSRSCRGPSAVLIRARRHRPLHSSARTQLPHAQQSRAPLRITCWRAAGGLTRRGVVSSVHEASLPSCQAPLPVCEQVMRNRQTANPERPPRLQLSHRVRSR